MSLLDFIVDHLRLSIGYVAYISFNIFLILVIFHSNHTLIVHLFLFEQNFRIKKNMKLFLMKMFERRVFLSSSRLRFWFYFQRLYFDDDQDYSRGYESCRSCQSSIPLLLWEYFFFFHLNQTVFFRISDESNKTMTETNPTHNVVSSLVIRIFFTFLLLYASIAIILLRQFFSFSLNIH